MSTNVSISFRNSLVGAYEYMRPSVILPTGLVFNPFTGLIDGTAYNTVYSPPSNIVYCTSSAQIQTAINTSINTAGGTTIKIVPGTEITGQITLKKRNITGWTYIITDETGSLPSITAGNVIGKFVNRVSPAHTVYMPNFNLSAANQPTFITENGADFYYFRGLAFGNPSNYVSSGGWFYIVPASGLNDHANYPNNIVIQQCYFNGGTLHNTLRAVYGGTNSLAMMDNYGEELGRDGFDSQFFFSTPCTGKHRIVNNYTSVGGASENFMYGGVAYTFANSDFIPSDVEVRGNVSRKPSWGQHKNHFELKYARRVLYEGNINKDHNGVGQQVSILAKIANQSVSNAYVTTRDVLVRCNKVTDVSSSVAPLGFSGGGPAAPGNPPDPVFYEARDNIFTSGSNADGITLSHADDVIIMYNTIVTGTTNYRTAIKFALADMMNRVRIQYNVFCSNELTNSYCVSSSVSLGAGETAFANHTDDGTFNNNLCVAPTGTDYDEQQRVATRAAIGFTDLAGQNYILLPSSLGYQAAPDSRDYGANIPFVTAMLAGVES